MTLIDEPYIKTFPGHTHTLSIIQGMDTALGWIVENFIQLITYRTFHMEEDVISEFYVLPYFENISHTNFLRSYNCFCPFIDVYNLPYQEPLLYPSITDFVKAKLTQNFYIYMRLDVSLIMMYSKKQGSVHHDPLIYGYDEDRFYLVDFIDGLYKKITCSYSELENSYNNILYKENELWIAMGNKRFGINCIMRNDYKHIFDANKVLILLKEYANPNYAYESYSKLIGTNRTLYEYKFGIDIYEAMSKRIDICDNDSFSDGKWPDLRSYHCLYEHKIMLSILIKYLFTNNDLYEVEYNKFCSEVDSLVHEVAIIRRLLIRYIAKSDVNIKAKVKKYLQILCKKEKMVIEDLVNCLSAKYS